MNPNDELKIKVTIDGDEYITTLHVAGELTKKLGDSSTDTGTKGKKAINEIAQEVAKFNTVSENNIQALTEWMSKQNLTAESIENTIRELQMQNTAVNINSDTWRKNSSRIDLLKASYGKLASQNRGLIAAQKQVTPGANQMTNAMGQLGYMLGDANMFAVNFRMGMMSIANNIPMVVQMLGYARAEINKTGASLKAAFVSSIMGPGGVLVGANALMLLLTTLPYLFEDNTKKIEEQAAATKKLADEKDRLAKMKDKAIGFKFSSIKEAEKELNDYTKDLETKIKVAQEKLDVAIKSKKLNILQAVPHISDEKLNELVFEKGSEIVKFRKELSKLKTDLEELAAPTEDLKHLKTFAGLISSNTINAEGLKSTLKTLTQNQLSTLQNSLNENNKTLKIGSELFQLSTEKIELLKNGFDELTKSSKERFEEEFQNKKSELELVQIHSTNMLKINGVTEIELLEKKKTYLSEKLNLYKKYGKDVKKIVFDIAETEAELQKSLRESYLGYTEDNIRKLKKEDNENSKLETIEVDDSLYKVADVDQEANLRIAAINDRYEREYAALEYWKEKELKKYAEDSEAKALIEEITSQKKLDITKREIDEKNILWNASMTAYETFTQNILDTQMTGAEKWKEIWGNVKQYFVSLLAGMLQEYILTKFAELSIHTATEAEKTAVTEAGAAARMITLVGEIAKTMASAAASMVKAIASLIQWQVAAFGPFALATIPSSIAVMMGIFNGAKKMLGLWQGGRFKKGEVAFLEGYGNEVVAPEETFVEVARNELIPKALEGILPAVNYTPVPQMVNGYSASYKEDKEMKQLLGRLNNILKNGIPAYFGNDEVRKSKRVADELSSREELG